MTRVSVRTYGTELFARELELTGARAEAIHTVFPQVMRSMEEVVRDHFATRGARSGNPWPPQGEFYASQKLARGKPHLMRYTDQMYRALTGRTSDSVREVRGDSFTFGADLVQFRVHQDYNPRSVYPERKPVDFSLADERSFVSILDEFIGGTRNRAGRKIDPVSKRFVEDPLSKAGRRRSMGL